VWTSASLFYSSASRHVNIRKAIFQIASCASPESPENNTRHALYDSRAIIRQVTDHPRIRHSNHAITVELPVRIDPIIVNLPLLNMPPRP
jgi:hypothetical protein